MRLGDVKDESMRLRNISALRRKQPSPTRPLCVNSQYSLNPQSTQKLWNDFHKSIAPSFVSQPKTTTHQQALRQNFKKAQISSPKTKKWSPTGGKDARQRANERAESTLQLVQQGINDAVATYGTAGSGSPLRKWSSSAGRA